MFTIEGYSYSTESLERVSKGEPLALEVFEYQPLTLYQYIRMKKSLALYARYIEKAMPAGITPFAQKKAAAKIPAGQRWITVHPNGDDSKGVPVLIQEDGGGTAHVIGGAGGRLNMLKLNNVKSKEEYAQLARERRDEESRRRAEERKQKEMERAGLTPEEKAKLREDEKARADQERAAEKERQDKISDAKKAFLKTVADALGWEDKSEEIRTKWEEARKGSVTDLQNAIDSEDKIQIRAAKKSLELIDKGYKQAMKSYESNMLAAAKSAVRDIQKEAIEDATIRAELESRIGGKTGAEEAIRTEAGGKSKGFLTGYDESAEESGLTSKDLSMEKEELFQANLERISEEISPQLANMIEKGVQTRRQIGEVKRELYEREKLEDRVKELDDKAEIVKKYLEMKKILEDTETPIEALQKTLDGETVNDAEAADIARDLKYGDGLALAEAVSMDDFTQSLEQEEARIDTERQAGVNASLLEKIKENPNGAEKWIANGHFDGFNRISLALLKDEGIPRDLSDILGLRASAQILARSMRASMSDEDFADAAEAIQRYHSDTNEAMAREATEAAEELYKKVESVTAQIDSLKATNPDDLAMLKELNETRIGYIDEANRVLGQSLGALEAAAMLGSVMKQGGRASEADANLGPISSEEAVVRMRVLGLEKEDYHIETINGDRIATIKESGLEKLTKTIDPEEIAIERDVEDIKRGVYDEPGWLPAGLVARPLESYQDPGVDANVPAGEIDNQSIADNAEDMKGAQEAAHRALGEMPEGAFAFKGVEDLTPQDQTDLRRYWEKNLFKGSMAERFSVRKYQGEKGVTKAGAWQSYLSANGGMEDAAYEAIKADLVQNHSEEDMFGIADPPAITKVNPADIESYRGRVDGASDLFDDIDSLEADIAANRLTVSRETAEAELSRKKAALPEKLEELRKAQLRDHYHKWMSGYSEEQYAAGESGDRFEGTPWGEYVRMHGDVGRAQSAVLETIRGKFVDQFAKHYGRVTKKPLGTRKEKIAEAKGHILGMLGKEERDSVIDKVQAELASAGATVANRAGGKFAVGSWRDKAIELIEQRRRDAASQGSFFGEEELKQDDGTERTSIGKRAEEQLASMIPELSQNQLRGQKYAVNTMQADGVRQRSIKMFERTKRMNLTFGTGKGKTIISIGAFTELHSKGKAKRAIFAVPSVVQSQFGCVSENTILIDAVTGEKNTFREMRNKNIRPNVFSINSQKQIEIIKASVPFIKGRDMFYEVTLDNGAKIKVTSNHKFFTPFGWKKLNQLSVDSRVFSDAVPEHDMIDARNQALTEDSLIGCHPLPRSCGEQPHLVKDNGQYRLPLQEHVEAHIQENWPLGGFSEARQYIQSFVGLLLPSSGLRLPLGDYIYSLLARCQHALNIRQPLMDCIYTDLRSKQLYGDLLKPISLSAVHRMGISERMKSLTQTLSAFLGLLCEKHQALRRFGKRNIPAEPVYSINQNRLLSSCVPYRNTSKIVSIVQVYIGDVYDLEVPKNHNYWCSGFWNHNSEINVFCEPGKYKAAFDPGMNREQRIEALKNPKNHMIVLTHQSIRDDLVYLMAGRMGKAEEEAKAAFNAMSESERALYLGETLKENGIAFDMLTVDEAHYTTNRKGKEDSTLSNIMDALNKQTAYFMNQTATPVKNDASEAFDMLHKVAPQRFRDRDEFLKRYGVDSDFARESLQRLVNRYNYASPTVTGVKANRSKETIELTPAQREAYNQVESAFQRASRAQKSGTVDVEAMKILSPNSFAKAPAEQHEELARRLQSAVGTIKEEALNRVVNHFDPANNAKIGKLVDLMESKRYQADHAKTAARKGDRAPGVVFAHNLASVDAIKKAFESKGVRVGIITGTMSGADKEKVKVGFNPSNPKERQYDMLVLSDAGATGLNLQNAKYLVNYDLPQTAWVKQQREGRIDRMGQAHDEIDYHDLVTDTEHEATKWDRVQRKARLGSIFQEDPGALDDSGLASYLAAVRQERYNNGTEDQAA